MAEFGVEVACLQGEFLKGVRRRNDGGVGQGIVAAIDFDIVVDAVQAEIVLPFVDAIDPEITGLRAACVGGDASATGSGRRSTDAGGHLRQRGPIAGGKGQIVDGLVGNGLADLGVFRFKKRRRSGDGDALLHIAGGEMNVKGHYLLHLHDHFVHYVFLEPGGLGIEGVFAGKQIVENVGAGGRGFGRGFCAGIVVGDQNGCILDDRTLRILDCSGDLSAIELSCQPA